MHQPKLTYRNDKINQWNNRGLSLNYKPLAYHFFSCLSQHLLPFFYIPSLHPCLYYCGVEVVSIATTQELGVGGFEAGAGRERWSALDKPPSPFSFSPSLLLFLCDRECVYS